MLTLGLSAAQQTAFHNALASSHSVTVVVQVLDLEHRALDDISGRLLSGQVDVDMTAEVTRTASLTFHDPGSAIGFDSTSPDKAALFLNRMIRIYYCVNAPNLTGWVNVPIFTGPITGLSRNGDVLQVECSGKEVLAQRMSWNSYSWPAGEFKRFVASMALTTTGEKHIDFMPLTERLGSAVALGPESIPWDLARSVVAGGDRQLFYDGRGVARLRKLSSATVFTLRSGDGGMLTSAPQVSYDYESVRNTVLVKGPVPKGAKAPIRAIAHALNSHPLSSLTLGRSGSRRYLVEVIELDTLRSNAEAQTFATQRLALLLQASTQLQCDSLVVPHLEPGDVIRVQTDDFAVTSRLTTFTIPLVASDTMSIGYQKRIATGPVQMGTWLSKPAKRAARVLKPAPRKRKPKPKKSRTEAFR